ncbi:hypothetical protein M438DRAFT_347868 [Aureobasidium pullulans EXF-150]|uniref:Uncharacterized protein n=1 Tax=Aureobasidium pullulans EXF-150 TaxID=1043002 RepID=A0A074XID5_AURPU|nr:uncharacterized protein M438DRAFT_347868 [Aureobasidium pullulans EXF-150]KEQ81792.1 hypothetical protein M438DRAFT_347868 [Aureobasidium pullulans EXF-150]
MCLMTRRRCERLCFCFLPWAGHEAESRCPERLSSVSGSGRTGGGLRCGLNEPKRSRKLRRKPRVLNSYLNRGRHT